MPTITVYQFNFLNPKTRSSDRSSDFATAEAIAELSGTLLPDTAMTVEAAMIGRTGLLARLAPPREEGPAEAGRDSA